MVFYVPRQKAGGQKTLNRTVASIPRIYSALNLFVHAILICQCCSEVFELCHTFKEPVRSPYAMLLSYCLTT
jgi:hypothetical protein